MSSILDHPLDFPDGDGLVSYFNNAGMTALPPSVASAGRDAVSFKTRPWAEPPPSDLVDDAAGIRRRFSSLVGGREENDGVDVAIFPSTSFALTMAARNLERTGRIRPHSKVVLLQDEMSSAVYCWQDAATRVEGLDLVIVPYPRDESGSWTEAILELIDGGGVSVACLPQVHWSDGSFVDLDRIGPACRRNGIALIVDATQSAGVMNLDVRRIDPDCLAASVHKWLLGPHGMSLAYVARRNWDAWMPLDQHERARIGEDSPMWDAPRDKLRGGTGGGGGYPLRFVSGARRCDAGGRLNPILVPMVACGLRIVLSYDLESVQDKLMRITSAVVGGAAEFGLTTTPGPRCGHIVGLRPGSVDLQKKLTPERMVSISDALKKNGIFIAVRSGAFRISPYLDTTQSDIVRLLDGLRNEIESL